MKLKSIWKWYLHLYRTTVNHSTPNASNWSMWYKVPWQNINNQWAAYYALFRRAVGLWVDISFVELLSSLIPLHARSCDKYFCLRYLRSLETSLLLTRFLLHFQDPLGACWYQSNYSQITVRYTLIWGVGLVLYLLLVIYLLPPFHTLILSFGEEKKNQGINADVFLIW